MSIVTSRASISLLACSVLLIALGVLSGCGSNSSDPPAAKLAAATTSPSPPPPPPPGTQAKAAVRSYYEQVNAGDYGAAWQHFSPDVRSSVGGFASWRDGYSLTDKTIVTSLRTVSATATNAVEQIRLTGKATDVCGNDVTQYFAGTWRLGNIGGDFVATQLDVAQTGGDELVTDSSSCAPSQPPPPTPLTTTTSACDPNYTGACLDPNSSDYDCEGGSGNGPDYTGPVQVVGDDHYGLDADGDGYACES